MNNLPEILRIVADLRDPKLEVIDEVRDKGSSDNIAKLYWGFRTREFSTDQVAAQAIYGVPQTDSKYTTLKSRLKRKLMNSLFLLDLSKKGTYSDYARELYASNKRLFIVKTLISLGARSSAIRIAEKTLPALHKYEFTSVECDVLLLLRTHASLVGNLKLYNSYDALLKQSIKLLQAESISWECYERFSLEFASSDEVKVALATKANEYLDRLKPYKADASVVFMLNYFRVEFFYFEYNQDVFGMLKVCDQAIEHLVSKPNLAFPIRFGEFRLKQLHCYLILRDYQNGFQTASECNHLFPKGTNNWFVYNELAFLLAMHTQHFVQAEGIYAEVTAHPRFESLSDVRKEKWRIFELYLKFALLTIPAAQMLTGVERPQVRIKSFLRSVPNYTKDKRGLNVAILVLQILFLIESEDFDGIINRMEALRTYRTRYLRSTTSRQSAIFFKLLQIMESNSFSYKLTKEKSKKYYEQLLATTSDSSDMTDALQILPFDWLWPQVLEMLRSIEEKHKSGVASGRS